MIDERRAPNLSVIKRPTSLRLSSLTCHLLSHSYSERRAEQSKGELTDVKFISFRLHETAKPLTISTLEPTDP